MQRGGGPRPLPRTPRPRPRPRPSLRAMLVLVLELELVLVGRSGWPDLLLYKRAAAGTHYRFLRPGSSRRNRA